MPISTYRGKKALLFVNVASECGLTNQNYKELSALYKKYSAKGLEILAFPCNQFGGQEPGGSKQVQKFAKSKGASFPIFDKVDVNGKSASAVFTFLKNAARGKKSKAKHGKVSQRIQQHNKSYSICPPPGHHLEFREIPCQWRRPKCTAIRARAAAIFFGRLDYRTAQRGFEEGTVVEFSGRLALAYRSTRDAAVKFSNRALSILVNMAENRESLIGSLHSASSSVSLSCCQPPVPPTSKPARAGWPTTWPGLDGSLRPAADGDSQH